VYGINDRSVEMRRKKSPKKKEADVINGPRNSPGKKKAPPSRGEVGAGGAAETCGVVLRLTNLSRRGGWAGGKDFGIGEIGGKDFGEREFGEVVRGVRDTLVKSEENDSSR